MLIQWRSFTTSAKIEVGTDCTLVSITDNPGTISLSSTVWAITIDTVMLEMIIERHLLGQRPIDWSKAMPRVFLCRRLVALGAVIPIRAVETLMSDSINLLSPC